MNVKTTVGRLPEGEGPTCKIWSSVVGNKLLHAEMIDERRLNRNKRITSSIGYVWNAVRTDKKSLK